MQFLSKVLFSFFMFLMPVFLSSCKMNALNFDSSNRTGRSEKGEKQGASMLPDLGQADKVSTEDKSLCILKPLAADAYHNSQARGSSVQKQNMGSGYIVYYPSNIDEITGGGQKCKLPVVGWSNGMTVGQGGSFPSDLVYGRTIRTCLLYTSPSPRD